MSGWQRLRALLVRPAAEAGPQSTDYLWDPSDTRSFDALRRSGDSRLAPPRPRPRPARPAAVHSEVGGGAVPLEELPAAPPEPSPLLRRRSVVLGGSFVVGALLALVVGTAIGAIGSGTTQADVDAAFEEGFADGQAATDEEADGG